MKVLLVHPGTQYSFFLAKELHRRNLLYKFITCFAVRRESFLFTFLRLIGYQSKISNRLLEGIPSSFIQIFPFLEIKAFFSKRTYSDETILSRRNTDFQLRISDNDIISADVVIGFDTSSHILAKRCQKLGTKFILDVSIGHPISKEKIYADLFVKYPLWSDQIKPKVDYLLLQEKQEMDLAFKIVVPSDFVKKTIVENGLDADKIIVNPFGTYIDAFHCKREYKSNKPLKFLFMGAFTARKGLPLLLEVWNELECNTAELIIAGYGEIPKGVFLPKGVQNIGAIAKDNRIQIFQSADVFVFPSYFEGLAQVQIEALAAGLPIIGTYHSGADELIQNGKQGFVIESGNKAALAEAINYFITNRDSIKHMSLAAAQRSEQFSWDTYGNRWSKILAAV